MRPSILILSASTVVVLTYWLWGIAEACDVCLFPHLRAQAAAVEQIRRQRDEFMPCIDEILQKVAAGQMSLREASAQLGAEAAKRHPVYLKNLDTIDDRGGLRAKLAHNLLRSYERHGPLGAQRDTPLFKQLHQEYQQMLADGE